MKTKHRLLEMTLSVRLTHETNKQKNPSKTDHTYILDKKKDLDKHIEK